MGIRAFLRSSGFLLVAFAIERLSGLVITVAVGRALGPGPLGEYSFVLSVWNIFSIFTYFGQNNILARDVARVSPRVAPPGAAGDYDDAGRLIGTSGVMVLAVSVVCCALMMALPFVAGYDRSVTLGLIIIAATALWADSEGIAIESALIALDKARWIAIGNGLTAIARAALIVGLVSRGADIVAVFWVAGIAQVVSAGVLWLVAGRIVGFRRLRWDRRLARANLGLSFTFVGSTAAGALFRRLDTVFVASLQGFEAVGFYASGYRIVTTLQALTMPAIRAAFPQFAVARAESKQALAQMMMAGVRACVAVATPLTIGVITLGPVFLLAALGDAFGPARLALVLLAPSILPGFVFILLSSAMNAANMERQVLLINLIDGIASVGLSLGLIVWLGVPGAAIAFTLTTLINLPLTLFVLQREGVMDVRAFLATHGWAVVWISAALMATLVLPASAQFSWAINGAVCVLCAGAFALLERRLIGSTLRSAWQALRRRATSGPTP